MFVMALNTLESLKSSRAAYYERYRFADVFSHLKRAPNSLAERVSEIPGVARVQTRVVVDVNLDVAGMAEPAVGRLISVPEERMPMLNDLHLRSGRYIEPGRPGEALVSEAFAQAHKLQPGDYVLAVINGRRQRLQIVGVALSPEYIIQIQTGGLIPDDKRFGVFWMGYKELASAFDMYGAFNDVSLTLMAGASENDVIQRLDLLTEPYGGLGAYGREDQVSHRYLSDEMSGLRTMGTIAPTIFLGVAAFLLNAVLSRIIATQREEIAMLKAFGYSNLHVGMHYMNFALVIVAVGTVIGAATGMWLGHGLTDMYARFYRFPLSLYQVHGSIVILGFLVSLVAAVIGVVGAVRRAVRLPPAEAMRPEPPASYRPTLVERVGLQRLFSQPARMILRHLERQPIKASLSCFGIALAAAILVVGSFMKDSLDSVMELQFQNAQRQDMMLTLVEPASAGALDSIEHLPGVRYAEPFRSVPVRLRHLQHTRRAAIMGLERDPDLYRVLDEDQKPMPLPQAGLALSKELARLMDANVGDRITVEVLEGKRPVRELPLTALVPDTFGLNVYMSLPALARTDAGRKERLWRFPGDRSGPCRPPVPNIERDAASLVSNIERGGTDKFSRYRGRESDAHEIVQYDFCQHHRVRRGLQQRSHFTIRTQPGTGDVARDRIHTVRNLDDIAGRNGRAHASGDPGGSGDGLWHGWMAGELDGHGIVSPPVGGGALDLRLCCNSRRLRRAILRAGCAPEIGSSGPGRCVESSRLIELAASFSFAGRSFRSPNTPRVESRDGLCRQPHFGDVRLLQQRPARR